MLHSDNSTMLPVPSPAAEDNLPQRPQLVRYPSSTYSAGSSEGEDRRLHNMPKELAVECVRAFISWGHDHRSRPAEYQAFLLSHLPRFPGVDGEKVRLFLKNLAASYEDRYLPARARGYPKDFAAWWEERRGRGRPRKHPPKEEMSPSRSVKTSHGVRSPGASNGEEYAQGSSRRTVYVDALSEASLVPDTPPEVAAPTATSHQRGTDVARSSVIRRGRGRGRGSRALFTPGDERKGQGARVSPVGRAHGAPSLQKRHHRRGRVVTNEPGKPPRALRHPGLPPKPRQKVKRLKTASSITSPSSSEGLESDSASVEEPTVSSRDTATGRGSNHAAALERGVQALSGCVLPVSRWGELGAAWGKRLYPQQSARDSVSDHISDASPAAGMSHAPTHPLAKEEEDVSSILVGLRTTRVDEHVHVAPPVPRPTLETFRPASIDLRVRTSDGSPCAAAPVSPASLEAAHAIQALSSPEYEVTHIPSSNVKPDSFPFQPS